MTGRRLCGSRSSSTLPRKRYPHQAAREFVDTLQEVVTTVAPTAVWTKGQAWPDPGGSRSLVLQRGGHVRLDGRRDLGIRLSLEYELVREHRVLGWRASTRAYAYAIEMTPSEQEWFAWHWHPWRHGVVRTPHFHARQLPGQFARVHVPTGRTSVEEVIRFAIRELDVVAARADWADTLHRTENRWRGWRTW